MNKWYIMCLIATAIAIAGAIVANVAYAHIHP